MISQSESAYLDSSLRLIYWIVPCLLSMNFIFANSVKRHICDVKILQIGHDLPISINDILISPFREDFIFMKLAYAKFRKNKTLAKFPNLL